MVDLQSSYDPILVSFSIFIAVIAAYTALELTERISSKGKIRVGWLLGSSLMMGTGVWSMHFVGMLAYNIGIPIGYDLTTVIISWMPAIIASGIVFYYLDRGFSNTFELLRAGTLMGAGIGAMHYIGMAAMRVPASMHYDYILVALSVVFAVILSTVSLATANYVVKGFLDREEIKIAGSFLMGTAISGMHYIGMIGVGFTPTSSTPRSYIEIANTGLASTIG
ncbi:MAG: MHYT domain-containing protein, partial [Prochloraceae cyanobacterium]